MLSVRHDAVLCCVQLDVKGCRNIYDSFDKYCEVETLEGDNQYNAEGHGMQVGRSHCHTRWQHRGCVRECDYDHVVSGLWPCRCASGARIGSGSSEGE